MILRVVMRRAALDELDNAVLWYEGQRSGLGQAFFQEIESTVHDAAASPWRFPVVHADIRRVVARRFPYCIYVRERGDLLVVVAIFHAKRDPQVWRNRS